MKNYEKILESIDLNEEQTKAFNEFISSYLNDWKGKIEESIRKEIETELSADFNVKAKKFEGKLKDTLKEELTEKLTKQLTEKITSEKDDEYGNKFEEALVTLNQVNENKLLYFTQELAKDIKQELEENYDRSHQGKALKNIIKTIEPFVIKENEGSAIEVLEQQKVLIEQLSSQIDKLEVDKTINELTSGLPVSLKEEITRFLGKSKTKQEVIDNFENTVKYLRTTSNLVESDEEDEELTDDEYDEEDDMDDEEEVEDDEEVEDEDDDMDDDEEDDEDVDDEEEIEDDDEEVEDDEEEVEDDDEEELQEEYFDDGIKTSTPDSINESVTNETMTPEMKRLRVLAGLK